ncbi:MAG: hypothetical protein QE285_01215 [Aquabacterium sp.]|nr:hypothetical protein [Aquabacterium sp.]
MKRTPLILSTLAALALTACGGGEDVVDAQSATAADKQALAATVAGRTLNFTYALPTNAKIIVGPAVGRVEVYGLPDIPDGTVYNNISAIDWRSGTAVDAVQFEVTQAADFDLRVDTGAGDAQVDVKWIIPAGAPVNITPSVNIVAGLGMKKIQMQLESFTNTVNFAWTQRLGDGMAEVKGEMQFKQGSVNATGLMDLTFGNGMSKAELTVDNEAQNLVMNINPRNIGELGTKILSDDPTLSSRVNFNPVGVAGGSKIGFEMLSGAQQVTLGGTLVTGAGMDEVLYGFTALNGARVSANLNARTGASMDKLNFALKGLPTTAFILAGSIDMGSEDDEALLLTEGAVTGTISVNCGPGIDKAIGFTQTTACELN